MEKKALNACGKYQFISTSEDCADSESPELCDVVKNIAEQPQAELSLGFILNTVKNTKHHHKISESWSAESKAL